MHYMIITLKRIQLLLYVDPHNLVETLLAFLDCLLSCVETSTECFLTVGTQNHSILLLKICWKQYRALKRGRNGLLF